MFCLFVKGGGDKGSNGLPLRADIHRLFDANLIVIGSDDLVVRVSDDVRADYGQYDGISLAPKIDNIDVRAALMGALKDRYKSNRTLLKTTD